MRFTLMCLLAFAALTSCFRKGSQEDIAKVDSLILINDSIGAALDQVDTTGILNSRDTFAANWSRIKPLVEAIPEKSEITGDSMWQYITLYEAKDRQVKKLIKRMRYMSSAWKTNQHQLSTLRESVYKGQIPADSVQIYIQREALEVMTLQEEVRLYLDDLISSSGVLDSLHRLAPAAIGHYQAENQKHQRKTR